jgi:hypothetical protein
MLENVHRVGIGYMVITRLIGGLGNQMFQYAAGRALAEKHDVPLKLDISPFNRYDLHQYSLPHLAIREELASKGDIKKLLQQGYAIWWKVLAPFRESAYRHSSMYRRQTSFGFSPSFFDMPSDVYLEGDWQSEKFFFSIREILLNEFAVVTKPSAENRDLLDQLEERNSVSIHIRRQDYVNDIDTQRIHGSCSEDYYRTGVRKILDQGGSPSFFVFSDDPQWVKENFTIDVPFKVIDHNDASHNYEDLRLMYSCKHNIIANSSFSWWGAWLNCNPKKMVIAPRRWFQGDDRDISDVIPKGFMAL